MRSSSYGCYLALMGMSSFAIEVSDLLLGDESLGDLRSRSLHITRTMFLKLIMSQNPQLVSLCTNG